MRANEPDRRVGLAIFLAPPLVAALVLFFVLAGRAGEAAAPPDAAQRPLAAEAERLDPEPAGGASPTPMQYEEPHDAHEHHAEEEGPAHETTEGNPSEHSAPRTDEPEPETDEPAGHGHGGHGHGGGGEDAGHLYDPLGTAVPEGELTELDEGRVMTAASRFAIAAYGYSGEDPAEYEAGVDAIVLRPEFDVSAAHATVDRYAENVAGPGGVESELTFDGWERTTKIRPYGDVDTVWGIARFTVEDPSGARSYTQEVRAIRWGSAWKVMEASEPREVEG